MIVLETPRLILRGWRESDREPFAAMCADPLVMRYFPALLTRDECDRLVDGIAAHFDRHGFGLYAVEVRETGAFAGFIGLTVPSFQAHFTPCVEIGWRLAVAYWNRGFATEGAHEVLRHAFEVLGLREIVSFTVPANLASRRVMEKLGMTHDEADDFDHPNLPEGHPLRCHVLYRLVARASGPRGARFARLVPAGGLYPL
jgi:RimJ/RimL family protein N-acetyltransferase